MWRSRKVRIALTIILGLLLVLLLWMLFRPGPAVEVVQPRRREVVELVIASGSLRAERRSDVGPEVSGTVARVLVDEGDRVSAGQTVIILERADAQEQLQQAQLALQTARRQLDVAQRGPLPEDIERARAELRQAQRVGTQRVAAARQRLAELERGGRPEERRAAEAELQQARAALAQAEDDFTRSRQLYEEGAVSEASLERTRIAVQQARAAVSAAEERLNLARQPASREQIEQARAGLQEAQATAEESVRIARASLDRLLAEPRIEDVELARARVREAEAAVRAAQIQLEKRTITAPINGVVTQRNVEPGQSVTPGATLLTISDMTTTEIVVETDESNLPKLAVGQSAVIIPPAYPEQPFNAVVTQVGPEVDPERGVVAVRLRPLGLPSYARPDLTVDANIEVARLPDALSVPTSAVLEEQGRTYVLVVEDGVAREENVRVLARGRQWVAVEGINPQAQVIVNAAGIEAGRRVRVVGGD